VRDGCTLLIFAAQTAQATAATRPQAPQTQQAQQTPQAALAKTVARFRNTPTITNISSIGNFAYDNKSLAPEIIDTMKTLTRERRGLHVKNDSIYYALIYYTGGLCYYADNDRAAIKYARRGIRINRNNHQNYHLWGMSLEGLAADSGSEKKTSRLNRKAMKMYERALKIFPRTPGYARGSRVDYPPAVHRDSAALHLGMGQASDSDSDRERHFGLAVENYGKVADSYDWRLWTSRFHSNYALALAFLSRYSTGPQAVRDSLWEQSVANIDLALKVARKHPDSLIRAEQLEKVSRVRERIDSIQKYSIQENTSLQK
jgi:tetratricopeptide (TPR) repeat protein